LARKERYEEAHEVLALVHGKGDRNHPWVLREFEEIKSQAEFERLNADVTYWELFKPKYIRQTFIAVFCQIWSQLTGMNVMMYYITYVFTMAGLKGNNLLVSSSIQYVINVVMTVPALLFMDRWGRRPTMMIGAALMATWMFCQCRNTRPIWYPQTRRYRQCPRSNHRSSRRRIKSCDCLLISLRRVICADLGTGILGLPQ